LEPKEVIFNDYLNSLARRVIENAIGILSSCLRVLHLLKNRNKVVGKAFIDKSKFQKPFLSDLKGVKVALISLISCKFFFGEEAYTIKLNHPSSKI